MLDAHQVGTGGSCTACIGSLLLSCKFEQAAYDHKCSLHIDYCSFKTNGVCSPSLKPSLSLTSAPRSSIQDSILTFFCRCTSVDSHTQAFNMFIKPVKAAPSWSRICNSTNDNDRLECAKTIEVMYLIELYGKHSYTTMGTA